VQTTDERLVVVEGRLMEQSQMFSDIRDALARLDGRFDSVDARLGQVHTRLDRVDARLGQVDTRLGRVEARLEQVDTRLDRMDRRSERLEDRVERVGAEAFINFRWVVTLQLITLVAIVSAVIGLVGRR
jgi:archaellum component FlaC